MQPDDPRRLAEAEALLLRAIGQVCRVPPPRDVAEWADAERVVAPETGSPWPGTWRTDRVPYLRDVMQAMTLSHPARRVTFLKSAQIGGSEAGLNLIGQVMAETPAPILVMLPSIDMMLGYNRLKLDPMIQATPALSRRVDELVNRDEAGSTVTFKRFPGGYLQLLTANSSANLQMRSARVLLMEEISEYPFDVDGRGDPVAQLEARAIAYSGREKILEISTPGEEATCRVTKSYAASSRGRYLVACPHCACWQTLQWESLRWPKGRPEQAAYHCEGCGAAIEAAQKPSMIAAGRWVHEAPELVERHAGFALNSLYSPMLSWADLAERWERAEGDQAAIKVFVQQMLGRAWREHGEAPDWQRLYDRREEWAPNTVPAGALVLTAGVDVQRDRLEASVWGWGRNRESWLVDHIVIPGSPFLWRTWEALAAALETAYRHDAGGALPISFAAVDSGDGVSTAEVYAFVRKLGARRSIAVKGRDQLQQAIALGGKTEVKRNGKRIGNLKLWLVGSSFLKGELYGQLRLDRPTEESGDPFPPGYIHLPRHVASEEVCRQMTAEELRYTRLRSGFAKREWIKTRERNEALDCRVYARAAAALLGVDRWQESRWAELQAAAEAPGEAFRRAAQPGLPMAEGDEDAEDAGPEAPPAAPPPVPMIAAAPAVPAPRPPPPLPPVATPRAGVRGSPGRFAPAW